jgi:hypothetical protein
MTDEEKQAAADAKAAEEAAAQEAEEAAKAEALKAAEQTIAEKDAQLEKLREERDNYKTVALKRLGKLPGDAEFAAGVDEKTGLTVEETVRKELLEREIAAAEREKDDTLRTQAREIAELKLALKNRPDGAIGNGSGSSTPVTPKDNVFSEDQLAELRRRAERLKADPEKFIEQARKNVLSRG